MDSIIYRDTYIIMQYLYIQSANTYLSFWRYKYPRSLVKIHNQSKDMKNRVQYML